VQWPPVRDVLWFASEPPRHCVPPRWAWRAGGSACCVLVIALKPGLFGSIATSVGNVLETPMQSLCTCHVADPWERP
jgi:hypothetical protein